MEENNLKELLNELELRGFSDQLLAGEIKRLAAYNLPIFSLKRQKQFGGDRMDYRLMFHWNDQELKYELQEIGVLYNRDISFEPASYLGINILALDKEMGSINWEAYWELAEKGIPPPKLADDVNSCIKALSELLHEGGPDAWEIAEELMYKYFPADIFAIFSKQPKRLAKIYEYGFNFGLEQYPHITADFAYLHISKKAGALRAQLRAFLPREVSNSDISDEVALKMRGIPHKAQLNFSCVSKDTIIELSVPVINKDNWYHAEHYHVSVRELPEIPSGIFNQVDAMLLDLRMQQIDWKSNEDLVKVNDFDGIEFDREVERIQEELFRMASDQEGNSVADQLRLKYFYNVPFFEDQISQEGYRLLDALPQKTAYIAADIPVDKVVNMIKGRPVVLKEAVDRTEAESWHKLEFNAPGEAGRLASISGFYAGALREMLANIPVDKREAEGFARRLMDGEKIETQANSGVQVTLMMSDNADKLIICDQHGREIPFNFKLDPEWKNPTVDLPQKKLQAPYQGKKNSRQKPKGL